jgi:hypothetical protein
MSNISGDNVVNQKFEMSHAIGIIMPLDIITIADSVKNYVETNYSWFFRGKK